MHDLISTTAPADERSGFPLDSPAPAESIAAMLGVADLDNVSPGEILDRVGDRLAGDKAMRYGDTRTDIEHDNTFRAFLALYAVNRSQYAVRDDVDNTEPVDTVMSDLLANLMHLCDATGVHFLDLVRRAVNDYNTELVGH